MASDRFQHRIDRLLDQIEEAVDLRDWETVSQLAQDVLVLDPGNGDANNFLGAAQRALGTSSPLPATQPITIPTHSQALTPTPDQPTSFANDRYEVKRLLGEGGKKKVYLAHDTLLDRDVAFALIKTEGLGRRPPAAGYLGRPRLWAASAPTLTSSPSSTLDQEQDQPYMVTELMGGGDVEGINRGMPTDHRTYL